MKNNDITNLNAAGERVFFYQREGSFADILFLGK
jgi:hypothetical protein